MINNEINSIQVKVLNSDNDFIGIFNTKEAVKLANSEDKDLICINENVNPYLCKIQKYDKFLYEQKKILKEKKKNSTVIVLKEIQLRPNTDLHDLKTKAKKVEEFLNSNNNVKINLKIKGREKNYMEIANETFDRFLSLIKNYKIDREKKSTDNSITAHISKGE